MVSGMSYSYFIRIFLSSMLNLRVSLSMTETISFDELIAIGSKNKILFLCKITPFKLNIV